MKRKLNIQMSGIAILGILATLIMSIAVFYGKFQQQEMEEMKNYASLLVNMKGEQSDYFWEKYSFDMDSLRITVVDKNGNVQYDNNADVTALENHLKRKEVVEAFERGEGKTVRKSSTLKRVTFYYAKRLDENYVVRVGKASESVWSIFFAMLPPLMFFTWLLVLMCIILSHVLSNKLLEPIAQMAADMNHTDKINVYKELVPFMDKISRQHEDIIKSSKMRQEFTANVTHELKTPLTAISGYSELIENGMADREDTLHFAGEIRRNSDRLLNLINDIIRLSELDTEKELGECEEFDLYVAAQNCVDMLQVSAAKHDVSLEMEGASAYIWANPYMIDEVLFNLCDNAIRYNNPGGKVWLRVWQDKKKCCILEVEDTGIGISRKHQQRIFERFYRVDKSRSKKTGGTGLGLAIVKHIAAKHSAHIDLDSEEGRGTRIRVTFVPKQL